MTQLELDLWYHWHCFQILSQNGSLVLFCLISAEICGELVSARLLPEGESVPFNFSEEGRRTGPQAACACECDVALVKGLLSPDAAEHNPFLLTAVWNVSCLPRSAFW